MEATVKQVKEFVKKICRAHNFNVQVSELFSYSVDTMNISKLKYYGHFGAYAIFNEQEEVQYVGQGKGSWERVRDHFKNKGKKVFENNWKFIFFDCQDDDKQARAYIERKLIAQFNPPYNRDNEQQKHKPA